MGVYPAETLAGGFGVGGERIIEFLLPPIRPIRYGGFCIRKPSSGPPFSFFFVLTCVPPPPISGSGLALWKIEQIIRSFRKTSFWKNCQTKPFFGTISTVKLSKWNLFNSKMTGACNSNQTTIHSVFMLFGQLFASVDAKRTVFQLQIKLLSTGYMLLFFFLPRQRFASQICIVG